MALTNNKESEKPVVMFRLPRLFASLIHKVWISINDQNEIF